MKGLSFQCAFHSSNALCCSSSKDVVQYSKLTSKSRGDIAAATPRLWVYLPSVLWCLMSLLPAQWGWKSGLKQSPESPASDTDPLVAKCKMVTVLRWKSDGIVTDHGWKTCISTNNSNKAKRGLLLGNIASVSMFSQMTLIKRVSTAYLQWFGSSFLLRLSLPERNPYCTVPALARLLRLWCSYKMLRIWCTGSGHFCSSWCKQAMSVRMSAAKNPGNTGPTDS